MVIMRIVMRDAHKQKSVNTRTTTKKKSINTVVCVVSAPAGSVCLQILFIFVSICVKYTLVPRCAGDYIHLHTHEYINTWNFFALAWRTLAISRN